MNLNFDGMIMFVEDVEKLKQFYVDLLRLKIVEEIPSEWLLLKAGSCTIGLHKIGDQHLISNKSSASFYSNTKIVFETNEDIFQLREQLIGKGVKLKEIISFDNYAYWLCDGEDPEGNIFQLKQKKN